MSYKDFKMTLRYLGLHTVFWIFSGSSIQFQRKLRPRLLYIIRKLSAQYFLPANVIVLLQIVSADSNRQNLGYLRPTVKQFTTLSFLL